MAATVAEHRNVILAVLGTSGGLAGILLVFLGLIISAHESYRSDTPASVLKPYRRMVGLDVLAFVIGVTCVGLSVSWLVLLREHQALYLVTVAVFAAQIVLTLVAAMWTIWRIVWG